MLITELGQVDAVEGQDGSLPPFQAHPQFHIGRHAFHGAPRRDGEEVQQGDLVRQDGRARQLVHLHTPCLDGEFPGRKMGDFPVVMLDNAGNVLYREGNGRIVQAEEQDRIHRPGGGGDQVLDTDRRHAQILDLRDVAAPEAREDPEQQGAQPDFP